MTIQVRVRGPVLVNANKNMLKAMEKALAKIGKSGSQEVRKNTPTASGFLRSNIRAQKPEVSRQSASITISAGWTAKAGRDVVYAHFIETGKRYPKGKQTRYRGSRMFKRAADILSGGREQSKFANQITKVMNGKEAA